MPSRRIHASGEPDSGRACRRGTTTFMTLTPSCPPGVCASGTARAPLPVPCPPAAGPAGRHGRCGARLPDPAMLHAGGAWYGGRCGRVDRRDRRRVAGGRTAQNRARPRPGRRSQVRPSPALPSPRSPWSRRSGRSCRCRSSAGPGTATQTCAPRPCSSPARPTPNGAGYPPLPTPPSAGPRVSPCWPAERSPPCSALGRSLRHGRAARRGRRDRPRRLLRRRGDQNRPARAPRSRRTAQQLTWAAPPPRDPPRPQAVAVEPSCRDSRPRGAVAPSDDRRPRSQNPDCGI